ncbi:MAG: zinc-ribbon domain-containing protein [Candidatus Aminicenantes bacterium]|nr:zinc-ribbon domain-containing protein [Candidatus Aminicenantes bacterium]
MDDIEAAVLARRRAKPQAASTNDIEAAIRARRQAAGRNPKSETPAPSPVGIGASVRNQCPQCARSIDPSDRFCAKCGAPLAVEATR